MSPTIPAIHNFIFTVVRTVLFSIVCHNLVIVIAIVIAVSGLVKIPAVHASLHYYYYSLPYFVLLLLLFIPGDNPDNKVKEKYTSVKRECEAKVKMRIVGKLVPVPCSRK